MRCLVFVFAIGLAAASAARGAEKSAIVKVGNARFTVVAKECIRLEYSETGKFIDSPSYFAANRSAVYKNFKLTKKGGATTIDTGEIALTYTPDGKPFSKGNLKAAIKKDGGTVVWLPGMENMGNLGGTIRTVDGLMGPVDLGEGVISRCRKLRRATSARLVQRSRAFSWLSCLSVSWTVARSSPLSRWRSSPRR